MPDIKLKEKEPLYVYRENPPGTMGFKELEPGLCLPWAEPYCLYAIVTYEPKYEYKDKYFK